MIIKKRSLFVLFLIGVFVFTTSVSSQAWEEYKETGYYNLSEFEELIGEQINEFNEAPMLEEKIAEGDIPEIEERLPDEPLVHIPWMEIGEYGGTLEYVTYYTDGDNNFRHINTAKTLSKPPDEVHHFASGMGGPTQPGILEDWSMTSDGLVFTATIREGLKWSDGEPVTTDDVAYYIEDELMNEEIYPTPPEWVRWGGELLELDIIDDRTFEITFAEPYGAFVDLHLREWSHFSNIMRPKHYLKQFHKEYADWDELMPIMEEEGFNDQEDWASFYSDYFSGYSSHLVGTVPPDVALDYPVLSPYVVTEVDGGDWTLERNPYFHQIDPEGNQLPYIDKIKRNYVSDAEMMKMEIVQGRSDLESQKLMPDDMPLFNKYMEEGGYKVIPLKTWEYFGHQYHLNLGIEDESMREILQDEKFRQALSVALDREHITEVLYMGTGKPAQLSAPPGTEYYEEGMEEIFAQYDPELAEELLDEVGLKDTTGDGWRNYPDEEPFIFPLEFYAEFRLTSAELAARYWEDVGINVDINMIDDGYFWELLNANEIVAFPWGWEGPCIFNDWAMGFAHAPAWQQWMESDGDQGIEPLSWAKELYEARQKSFGAATEEERNEYIGKVWKIQTENLFKIGTTMYPSRPLIYSEDLGNISIVEERDYSFVDPEEHFTQIYFKNQ